MSNVGFATLSVIPSLKGMERELQTQLTAGVQKGAAGAKSTVAPLARSIAGALGGFQVGRSLTGIFNEVDTGLDTIRTQTGATGSALKGLEGSFKRVGGSVPDNLTDVGATLAELSSRTGLTGKPLERLTKQMLDLRRTGPGVGATTASITRLFGDWSIATDKQAGSMDLLFRASQATGPPVEEISQLLVRFGAPLRQLGFGFETSAVLLGKFQKEGVNTELVMGSLRIALGKMSKGASKEIPAAFKGAETAFLSAQNALKKGDAPAALRILTKSIKDAGSVGQANARALTLFGARAGPDMAAAIREGRFDLGALFDQVKTGGDTISTAAGDALDFGDRIKILGNKIKPVIAPLGEFGQVIGGLGAGFGALSGAGGLKHVGKAFGSLGKAVGGLGKAFLGLLTNPVFLVIAGLVVLGVIIFKFRKQILGALQAIGGALVGAGKAILGFFTALPGRILGFAKRVLPIILGVLFPPAGIALALIKFWGPISSFFKSLPGRILGFVVNAGQWLLGLGKSIITGLWKGLVAAVGAVWSFFTGLPARVVSFFANAGRWLWKAGLRVIKGLNDGIRNAFVTVGRFFRELPGKVISFFANAGRWLLSAGARILGGLWRGFNDPKIGWPATLRFFRELPGRILRAIGDLGNLLFRVGVDLIKGLLRGITSLAGKIKDAILAPIKGAVGGVKRFLHLGSPSKLFELIGSDTMKGLVQGLAAGEAQLADQFAKMTARFEGFGAAVTPLSVRAEAAVRPMRRAAATTSTAPRGGDIHVNIHNPKPEPASTSFALAMRRAQLVRVR